MVVEETTVYLGYGGVFALGAFVIGALATRESGMARRMALVGAIPAASIAMSYTLMGLEVAMVETAGREQSVMRFVGYTTALVALGYILTRTVSLSRRKGAVLTAAIVLTPWVSFVSWFLTGVLESVVTLASLGLFGLAAYYLFGPLNAIAVSVGGKPELLYAKLRNLFILGYGTLILLSVASEQVLGLLTAFVATVAAGYADGVVMLGIGFLVHSSLSIWRTGPEPSVDPGTVDTTVEPSD